MSFSSSLADALSIFAAAGQVQPVAGGSPVIVPSRLRNIANALVAQELVARLQQTSVKCDIRSDGWSWLFEDFLNIDPSFDLDAALSSVVSPQPSDPVFSLPHGIPDGYLIESPASPPRAPFGGIAQAPSGNGGRIDEAVDIPGVGALMNAFSVRNAADALIDSGLAASIKNSVAAARAGYEAALVVGNFDGGGVGYFVFRSQAAPGAPFTICDKSSGGRSPIIGPSAVLDAGTYPMTVTGFVRSEGTGNPNVVVRFDVDGTPVASATVTRSSPYAASYVPISISFSVTASLGSTLAVVNDSSFREFASLKLSVGAP